MNKPLLGGVVLVACDFSKRSERAISWARYLRAKLHCGVALAHVEAPPETSILRAAQASFGDPDAARRVRSFLESELILERDKVFGPDAQAITVKILRGHASTELLSYAKELSAGLILVGTSGKNAVDRVLLGSTTAELLRHSPIPVMTLH